MLCVSVASESRTLAKADLLNAARLGDVVELCLDRFSLRPDVASLIAGLQRPVIVSCRRQKDGGFFTGSEDERLALLREAITALPAAVELEWDIAPRFAPHPQVKRIISVNSPFRAVTDIQELLTKAVNAGADYVKFVWPGLLLDSLEPVLTAMAANPPVPIVGVPIGPAARAFAVMAAKLGAPWVYSALERGMETHDGMPLARDLEEQFAIREVDHESKLVGAIGFGSVRQRTVQAFNSAFAQQQLNFRCVPLEVGSVTALQSLLETLHLSALVVAPQQADYLLPLIDHPEPAVAHGQSVDLALRKKDGWHGFNVLWRSTLKVLERTLKRQGGERKPLDRTNNLILGAERMARSMLFGLKQVNATAVLTAPGSRDEVDFCSQCGEALPAADPAGEIARSLEARYVPFAELATVRPDVLIVTGPAVSLGFTPQTLNPLLLQPPLVVVDLSEWNADSDVLIEARERGCTIVRPQYILAEHLATLYKAITNHDLPDPAYRLVAGMMDGT